MNRLATVVAVTVLSLGATACGSEEAGTGSDATSGPQVLHVVTTTAVLTDLAANVGGADIQVTGLLKANVDPHDFEPTPADLNVIAGADVIVTNGVGLEKWFEETIESAEPHGVIVDASAGVALRQGDEGPATRTSGTTRRTPRSWSPTSPTRWLPPIPIERPASRRTSPTTRPAWTRSMRTSPPGSTGWPTRSSSPTTTRSATTSSTSAWSSSASVIPSFDTQAELSPSDINDLVAKIEAEGVKAVFVESSLPPKTAAAIAGEAGVKVVDGEDALFGDALGPEGGDGDTYLKMQAHNTAVIVEHLA